MVEENFKIYHSKTLQIDLIMILSGNHYFTMVEEITMVLPALTMVEEIFEIWTGSNEIRHFVFGIFCTFSTLLRVTHQRINMDS